MAASSRESACGQADGAASAREKYRAHLRHVDLEFAAGVSDAGLLALRGCALETLNLNACQQCVVLTHLFLCRRAATGAVDSFLRFFVQRFLPESFSAIASSTRAGIWVA